MEYNQEVVDAFHKIMKERDKLKEINGELIEALETMTTLFRYDGPSEYAEEYAKAYNNARRVIKTAKQEELK